MKIIFISLISHYTSGLLYQDNCFSNVLVNKGNEVTVISDAQCFEDGILKFTKPCDYIDNYGVRLIRVPYLISNFIGSKFKLFKSIYGYLEEIKPDVIYCHSPQYISVLDIVKYKNKHPDVKVYADTHTTFMNAKNSKLIFAFLYRIYYKMLYKILEPYLEKYFYVGTDAKDFSVQVYSANEDIMEFLPLGGEEISNELYIEYRNEIRNKLNLKNDDIMLFHSGKLLKNKNTSWLVNSLEKLKNKKFKLVIAGSIPDENKELKNIIENRENITYVGWVDGNDLRKYLCACDIYCQPGTPSVTLQTAICCKAPIICYKYDFYHYLYDYNSILWIEKENDIIDHLNKILTNKNILDDLKKYADINSYELDTEYLLNKAIGV